MRIFRRFLLVLLSSLAWTSVHAQETPRNIIFLIGDGMGTAQVSAQLLRRDSSSFRRFPVAGFSLTQSANNLVTESAAGATALATGRRTKNGRLSMDAAGAEFPSLLDRARAIGKATGVVVTCSVTHATPAAFMAHVDSRKKEFEIARQISAGGADVLIGGGVQFFAPIKAGGERPDELQLLDSMRARGYDVRTDSLPPRVAESIVGKHASATLPGHDGARSPAVRGDASPRRALLLAPEALPKAGERQYALADLVHEALSSLEQDRDGFVLIVEGSQIDWAAHDNDFAQLLREMEDFDGALGAALDFALGDGSTLVVVTADHETGGLTLYGKKTDGSDMQAAWSSKDHSAAMVPVFAFGPGSARFGGIHRNDEIGSMLIDMIR